MLCKIRAREKTVRHRRGDFSTHYHWRTTILLVFDHHLSFLHHQSHRSAWEKILHDEYEYSDKSHTSDNRWVLVVPILYPFVRLSLRNMPFKLADPVVLPLSVIFFLQSSSVSYSNFLPLNKLLNRASISWVSITSGVPSSVCMLLLTPCSLRNVSVGENLWLYSLSDPLKSTTDLWVYTATGRWGMFRSAWSYLNTSQPTPLFAPGPFLVEFPEAHTCKCVDNRKSLSPGSDGYNLHNLLLYVPVITFAHLFIFVVGIELQYPDEQGPAAFMSALSSREKLACSFLWTLTIPLASHTILLFRSSWRYALRLSLAG